MNRIFGLSTLLLSFIFSLSSSALAQERVIEPAKTDAAFLNKEVLVHLSAANPDLISVKTGEVFTEGGDYNGVTLPHLISNPRPISYPRWAVRQGWQGELVLALEILENGSVGRFSVMKSTGHKLLDETAIKSVKGWQFSPAIKNGKPLAACIQIPILFQLQGE